MSLPRASSDWSPRVVRVRAGSAIGVVISAPPDWLRIRSAWWFPAAATVSSGSLTSFALLWFRIGTSSAVSLRVDCVRSGATSVEAFFRSRPSTGTRSAFDAVVCSVFSASRVGQART